MSSSNQIPRRIPALLSYLHPFRIVTNEELTDWVVTIEQVNQRTWDYETLHRVVGGIDVGLTSPYNLLVGFDGALALPPIPGLLAASRGVEFFNRVLGALLLGGIYCEAVNLDSVERGDILDWKFIRAYGRTSSFIGQFHNTVRMKMAPPIHAIELMNPRKVKLSELQKASARGFQLLSKVPELTPEFLLKGVTGLARKDWGNALSNLWIVIEQITSHLWSKEMLGVSFNHVPGRRDQLKDNRSWTAATKQEVLHQKGILTINTLGALFVARKSRNDLFHNGTHPDKEAAVAALHSIHGLLIAATQENELPLFSLNIDDHQISDPFQPPRTEKLNVAYWMDFPKLPGEDEISREEARSASEKV